VNLKKSFKKGPSDMGLEEREKKGPSERIKIDKTRYDCN